ncbi:MAG: molybdopterin molybdotransferase MoeA [Gaiellaceae bacterium]
MTDLISFEDAQRLVLEHASPLPAAPVAVAEAYRRVAAVDVRSAVDLPPFDSSAMDGFAVRAEDTPGVLPIVFHVAAGTPASRPLGPGEAMGIGTGGALPVGADAVIPIESVVQNDNRVKIPEPVAVGANVRPVGGDLRRDDVVVSAGTVLGAAQVGALAASGVAHVSCARRPRAAVLATGSELRPPGEPLGPGQIYEANGPILDAQLRSAGAEVERLPAVADDEDAHREAIARGLEADVLLTTGGVSVGVHDLVRQVEAELGVREVFWDVAVKPGKPISFGVREGRLVFGLPGNPVSALVGFELFVRPAVRALQGASEPGPEWERGRLAESLRANSGRDELVRARVRVDDDGITVEPLAGMESHMIARAAGANALVLVPRGEGEVTAGSSVHYLRLG